MTDNRLSIKKIYYFNSKDLVSIIIVDEENKQIFVENLSNDIFHLPFGIIKNPSWTDYLNFLEKRCIPKTRYDIQNILKQMDLNEYNPKDIVKITHGRVADDNEWLSLENAKENIRPINLFATKGNQTKWIKNNIWYKLDGLGYESLSEFVVSRLLKYTNVLIMSDYTNYSLKRTSFYNAPCICCTSYNFKKPNEKIITLSELFKLALNIDIYKEISKIPNIKERINYVVKQVARITGLKNFGEYLTIVLELDAFFLNEDRHFDNIAFILNSDGNFDLCPLYDFGASMFSDTTTDYSLDKNYDECLKHIFSKPFSENFDEQCEAAEQLFGVQFEYNFSMKEVDEVLDQAKEYYSEEIIIRVRETLAGQLHKYKVYQNDKLPMQNEKNINTEEKQMEYG